MKKLTKNKFIKKNGLLLIAIFFSVIVYWRWFSFDIFTVADWWFAWSETLKTNLSPSLWNATSGIGVMNATSWKLPVDYLFGLFGLFGLNSNVADKFISFIPYVILSVIAGYSLVYRVLQSKIAAFIGSFVFCYNTYFLSINTQGHLMLPIASIFVTLSLSFLMNYFESDKKWHLFVSSLFAIMSSWYDFRMTYIFMAIILFYLAYQFLIRNSRKTQTLTTIMLLIGSIIILNFYWLILFFTSGSLSNGIVLNRILFGNEFFNIARSMSLFFPFWTGAEPSWFVVQEIPLYFWLIPIFAFLGLYLNRKNEKVIFWFLIGLIGIFLSKQVGAPFGGLYTILFKIVPGFDAFREASKFYFLTVLSYSVLIGALIKWLWDNWKNGFFVYVKYMITVLVFAIFGFNTRSIITGSINSLHVPRTIPNDYIVLDNFITKQPEYFRTIWVPANSRWGRYTNNHPVISTVGITQTNWSELLNFHKGGDFYPVEKQITEIFNRSFSKELLDQASIKYVIVPLQDIKNEDDFYAYYGKKELFIKELDKINFLKKIDIGTTDIAIYENKSYFPHLYLTDSNGMNPTGLSDKMSYSQNSSTNYEISINNIKEPVRLNFAESYNQEWKLRPGAFSWLNTIPPSYSLDEKFHEKTKFEMNAYLIDPQHIRENFSASSYSVNQDGSINLKLVLYYRLQVYYYSGLIISLLPVFAAAAYFIISYIKYLRMKNYEIK